MIQAIGLTSTPRRRQRPTVDDLTFEARPGAVTVLCGPEGAGKTSAVELMLQLRAGRGVALFRGRPMHRVPQPAREIGILLGEVPGHPDRTAKGYLRMMAAVAGVPGGRVEDVLAVVDLEGMARQRLGAFSRGMNRRLGVAAALLGDPHTLVVDEPTAGLPPREASWLHGILRGFAEQGGTVFATTDDPGEAAALADRVLTLQDGRLLGDENVSEFAQTRLRPHIVVLSPDAERLAGILVTEAEAGQLASVGDHVEVVRESENRLSVYGASCASVGDAAFRAGVLVHRLAVEGRLPRKEQAVPEHLLRIPDPATGARRPSLPEVTIETRSPGAPRRAVATAMPLPTSTVKSLPHPARIGPGPEPVDAECEAREEEAAEPPSPLPPKLRTVRPGPVAPVRYELLRMFGVRMPWLIVAATVLVSLALGAGAVTFDEGLRTNPLPPLVSVVTGWAAPAYLLLPPTAIAAGILGALSFGQEFRFPSVAPQHLPVPRKLGLSAAKLLVSAAVAIGLTLVVAIVNASVLSACYGLGILEKRTPVEAGAPWYVQLPGVAALAVGCAWVGLLAAGLARRTAAGLLALAAVPLAATAAVRNVFGVDPLAALVSVPQQVERWTEGPLPAGLERWVGVLLHVAAQPLGQAVALALTALLCIYALTVLRTRAR
ncbi:ABC transporter ATP-binding protein [Streptomyces sulphureus]|uniref:ATP-binding cassette domain-containing protein n=1 Tax=Streptomyces sulphureus TaxID=47758 RepID=UPI00037AF1AA|nr:ABC transporter ATP-binding protein [Streptomyces sulphureus]